ncbi:hypothetical protein C0Z18_12665 [Trinickia dabaoshanensis]|uniref:Uncharacterized protein n=1 Tax=Trinickia dabaoshanensis TaxID=564714 RepID=A0A2N7VRA6_9BURK|nr:hypothetical protein C0Z18_12665 [Trinickia dabaoshanensis]
MSAFARSSHNYVRAAFVKASGAREFDMAEPPLRAIESFVVEVDVRRNGGLVLDGEHFHK